MSKETIPSQHFFNTYSIADFNVYTDEEGNTYNILGCMTYDGQLFPVKVDGHPDDIGHLYRIRQSLIGRRAVVKYTASPEISVPTYATLVEILDV